MNPEREFSYWHRLARELLEPQDVARIIEPTLADAQFERCSADPSRAWLWRHRVALLNAIIAALLSNVSLRLRQAHWHSYLLLLLSGLSGAAVLSRDDLRPLAINHIVFLGVALALGATVVCLPQSLLHHLGTLSMFLCFVGLAICPGWGEAYGGRRQWLKFWDLQIHIAILALPAFVAFVVRCVKLKRYAWLSVGVVITLALVALENNGEATVVYAAAVMAGLLRLRSALASWILTGLLFSGVSVAWVSAPDADLWTRLGTAALSLALIRTIHSGNEGPHDVTRQTVLVALVSLTALRGLCDGTVPLVGFGGSTVVAVFVLMAQQMRAPMRASAQ